MLKFKKVTKDFGDITALEDVSFEIEPGEFVFITGPSGAGKTTILRLIMRELIPTKGDIELAGEDIVDLPKKKVPRLRQNIGFVFQDFKVLPHKTVKENIELALAVTGRDRKEWDSRVDKVLDVVGLIKRKSLFPSQLSGGELQRVSLARALVVNPKIILADEPTGNLDWDTADKLMQLLEKINDEGKTVIMATHHKGITKDSKKRKIRIKKGRVTEDTADKKDSKKKGKDEKPATTDDTEISKDDAEEKDKVEK